MVFEGLATRLQDTFKRLRNKGKLTEAEVNEVAREVRVALLEADVNFKVVKDFIVRLKERAVGLEVLEALNPAQQVIKIVDEELTALMGGTQSKLAVSPKPPTIIMLVGLQGAGKTTAAGKLANHLVKNGRRPLLVAADIYRPAAVKQLQVLGEKLSVPVFSMGTEVSPVDIARGAMEFALKNGRDTVLIDTAGRLHINEELMEELVQIKKAVKPHEILLVVDAMTGQEAVNVAQTFHELLGVDGVVMTKLDSDTRGGAALSIRAVTGCPIKFVGEGEKLDTLSPFYPDRMASRILGMGDMLSLIEKAESSFTAQKAQELEEKIRTQRFTFNDYLEQMQQVRKMGPLDQILGMIPGFAGAKKMQGLQIDEKQLGRVEAIIRSMTAKERERPEIIDGSRRKRIARGSGTKVHDVNGLLEQFQQFRKMMRQITDLEKGGKGKQIPKLPFMR